MQNEDQLLKKRLIELSRRAYSQQRYTTTEFLTLAEQDTLRRMLFDVGSAPFELYGGFDTAERQLACFGSEALCGYAAQPPISCVEIAPISKKFADSLSHRDILGALMSLGVRRSVLGDIVLKDNVGYVVCLDSIAEFIAESFVQVKHTTVISTVLETPPDVIAAEPETLSVNVASERLDALIAVVYKMSRSDAQALFRQGKVFVGGRLTENTSAEPSPGAAISVRGYGRLVYEGISKQTKKGRLFVNVRVY